MAEEEGWNLPVAVVDGKPSIHRQLLREEEQDCLGVAGHSRMTRTNTMTCRKKKEEKEGGHMRDE